MTQIIGVLRTAPANSPITGIAPQLAMTAKGDLFTIGVVLNSAGDPLAEGGSIAITTTNVVGIVQASELAIGPNVNRRSLGFFNRSTTVTLFLGFGVTATILSWPLLPNAFYSPPAVFQGIVNVIGGAAGPSTLAINEGV